MPQVNKKTPTVIEVEQKSTEIIAQPKDIVKTDAEIDAYIELRKQFIQKVNAICVEGKDYHVIQNKKSLAKGGAEKIASIFKWTAKFDKDQEALEMLGDIKGLVAFKCTLMNGQFVGEGRGAAMLSKNGGDPNKTLKMAQKSAFIDAVLRASGLSDFFTQDLEDMGASDISKPQNVQQNTGDSRSSEAPKRQPTEKQAWLIAKLCREKQISQTQVIEMAKGKTPSELITVLMDYQSSEQELDDLASQVPF